MVYEDYTTYTEVEPDDRIQKTAQHIDAVLHRGEDSYLYKDRGSGHFQDFEHLVDAKCVITSNYAIGTFWAVANAINDIKGLGDAGQDFPSVHFYKLGAAGEYKLHIRLLEFYNTVEYLDAWTEAAIGTWYYLKIKKTGTSMEVKIYSDSARTNLLDTLTLTLHADWHLRYIYGCNSFNTGTTQEMTLDIEKLDLQEVVIPTVTTQGATGIGFDSPSAHATLHGTITDTGGENADERGFDWDYDSGAPYTYSWTETDSYGTGAFSHQVTGLTEGVTIYFRAKAHNSAGWGYGGELSFKTPKAWTKTLTEPLGLLDTYSRAWTIYRIHSEILVMADVVSKEPSKTFPEALGLIDGVTKDPQIVKSEMLGLVDVYSRVWNAYRTYSEPLGLLDSISKGFTLSPLTETLGLTDSVSKSPSLTRKEALGLVDAYSRTWQIHRTYTELLGLLDSISKDLALRPLEESLGLKDVFTRELALQRTFTEALGLSDSISKGVSLHALTEVLGLLDSIRYTKNPTILAKLIRKLIQLEEIGGEERE